MGGKKHLVIPINTLVLEIIFHPEGLHCLLQIMGQIPRESLCTSNTTLQSWQKSDTWMPQAQGLQYMR